MEFGIGVRNPARSLFCICYEINCREGGPGEREVGWTVSRLMPSRVESSRNPLPTPDTVYTRDRSASFVGDRRWERDVHFFSCFFFFFWCCMDRARVHARGHGVPYSFVWTPAC